MQQIFRYYQLHTQCECSINSRCVHGGKATVGASKEDIKQWLSERNELPTVFGLALTADGRRRAQQRIMAERAANATIDAAKETVVAEARFGVFLTTPMFMAVAVAFIAMLISTAQFYHTGTQGVSCGAHRAASCATCPEAPGGGWKGKVWCNGQCVWDDGMERCVRDGLGPDRLSPSSGGGDTVEPVYAQFVGSDDPCQRGYTLITSPTDCQLAAKALGYSFQPPDFGKPFAPGAYRCSVVRDGGSKLHKQKSIAKVVDQSIIISMAKDIKNIDFSGKSTGERISFLNEVKFTALCKRGCSIPEGWCQSPGMDLTMKDVDDDGVLDYVCLVHTGVPVTAILTSQDCTETKTFPHSRAFSNAAGPFSGFYRTKSWAATTAGFLVGNEVQRRKKAGTGPSQYMIFCSHASPQLLLCRGSGPPESRTRAGRQRMFELDHVVGPHNFIPITEKGTAIVVAGLRGVLQSQTGEIHWSDSSKWHRISGRWVLRPWKADSSHGRADIDPDVNGLVLASVWSKSECEVAAAELGLPHHGIRLKSFATAGDKDATVRCYWQNRLLWLGRGGSDSPGTFELLRVFPSSGLIEDELSSPLNLWFDPVAAQLPDWSKYGQAAFARALWIGSVGGALNARYQYATHQLFGNLSSVIPLDIVTARSTLLSLADQGYTPAQHLVSMLFEFGIGGRADQQLANTHEQFAALGGSVFAQLSLASRLTRRAASITEVTCNTAINYARRVADVVAASLDVTGGNREPIDTVSVLQDGSELYGDLISYWKFAASAGNALAQFQLGEIYSAGLQGAPRDVAKAIQYYSAAKAIVPAKLRLGDLHERGVGVPQDYKLAYKYFEQASKRGSSRGAARLALLQLKGLGCKQDFDAAVHNLQMAANRNDSIGELYLGVCFYHGWGVEADIEVAMKLFTAAARQGSTLAAYNIGLIYQSGKVRKSSTTVESFY